MNFTIPNTSCRNQVRIDNSWEDHLPDRRTTPGVWIRIRTRTRTLTRIRDVVPAARKAFVSFWALVVLTACGGSYERPDYRDSTADAEVFAEEMMISAAHPAAVDAGLSILENGGNAMDAAVAVQMALNVAEPPESGIGGGAFLLYKNGETGELTVFDGRETAPAAATPDRFTVFGYTMPLWAAVPTGRSVGVPGTVAMLHQAHSDAGKLDWESLFDPAIRLAVDGVPMPGRLQRQLDNDPSLWLFRETRHLFMRRDGDSLFRNPQLAETFRGLASEGPGFFYDGPLTERMVDAAASRRPGRSDLTLTDFRNYQAVTRDAVCSNYREWTICGMPAPSSGGITLLQILGMLEHFPIGSMTPGDPQALHLIAETSRLAFADRARYIGDPDFVDVPQQQLLDSLYLAARAALIDPGRAAERVHPGEPEHLGLDYENSNNFREISAFPFRQPEQVAGGVSSGKRDGWFPGFRSMFPREEDGIRPHPGTTGTSHFSIVDRDGNAVSMTTSIESPFGSRIMTDGFLLNNQLTDFDFHPGSDEQPSPNAVAPGKRPRSSMAPVMVFDDSGELRLVAGSRGGSRIIGYVLKTLIGVLDWEMSLPQAISLPNVLHRGDYLEMESETPWADSAGELEAMGHDVRVHSLESGVHGIERVVIPSGDFISDEPDRIVWRGGADPRMEGVARGDRVPSSPR